MPECREILLPVFCQQIKDKLESKEEVRTIWKFHFIHNGINYNHCVSKSNNFYHISIFMFVCVSVWKYQKTKKKTNCFSLWLVLFYIYYLHQFTMAFMYEEHRLNFDFSGPCSIFVWNDLKHGLRISNKCIHICTAPKFAFFVVDFCCSCPSSLLLRVKMLQSIKTYLISSDKIRLIRQFFTHFNGKYIIWISLTHITILPYS